MKVEKITAAKFDPIRATKNFGTNNSFESVKCTYRTGNGIKWNAASVFL